jgi:hypothetical protein
VTSALRYLGEAPPTWFMSQALNDDSLVGLARIPKTPWGAGGILLEIFGDLIPRVREKAPGAILPSRCPERHIQSDQTFCLGLRYLEVNSPEKARQWWEQLRQFLVCQSVAERTGIWPPAHSLDHSDAGKHHERALSLAASEGLEEEYAAARLGEPSWITDPKLHLFGKTGVPINGRSVCPRGCRRRARGRMVPLLRKECSKRKVLVDLAFVEKRRRAELETYWKQVFSTDTKCCRTMKTCPLRDREEK